MSSTKITLTDNQLKKIKRAYKRQDFVRVRLQHNQLINGKHEVLLTPKQANQIGKARHENRGIDMNLSYEQLKINHTGGFLPLVFAGLGALGALISGGAAVVNSVINTKAKDAEFQELKRHNRSIEDIEGGVRKIAVGKGLKKGNKRKGTF